MATDNVEPSMEKVLSELLKWVKLIYGPSIGQRLSEILDTEEKRKVYEATDGNATVREISKIAGVNKDTITKWWKEWSVLAILEPGPVRDDRPRRIISLKTFGLD